MRIVLALLFLGAVSCEALGAEADCAYDPKLSHLSRIVAAELDAWSYLRNGS